MTKPSEGRSLQELLDLACDADGATRIDYRDAIAAFGFEAIESVAPWIADPRLGHSL